MKESKVRTRILETAGRLFYEQGYHLTGISQVIDEANIARGSFYNHFESKSEILLEYLDRFQETWFREADAFLAGTPDPRKKILALFEYRIQSQLRHGYSGCPFIKVNHEISREETAINERVQAMKDRLKAYIHQLVVSSGHKKALTDEALTEMIYLMMEGGITSAAIYRDVKDLRSAKKIVQQLL